MLFGCQKPAASAGSLIGASSRLRGFSRGSARPDVSEAYKQCQSLVKGLDILSALNRCSGGSTSITELVRQTGIHRTTVKRLLETLKEEGYITFDPATNLYRLSFRVRRLAYGYQDDISLVEVAWPIMKALSKKIVWPCSILSPEGDEMVVRASTRQYSPLSFHPGMPGRKLPILTTAAGRAYFASCSELERDVLIEMMQSRNDEDGKIANNAAVVSNLVKSTLKRGYAINYGDWTLEPKFGGIAVPLQNGGSTIACLNVIFLLRGVKGESALAQIANALMEAKVDIEEEYLRRKCTFEASRIPVPVRSGG